MLVLILRSLLKRFSAISSTFPVLYRSIFLFARTCCLHLPAVPGVLLVELLILAEVSKAILDERATPDRFLGLLVVQRLAQKHQPRKRQDFLFGLGIGGKLYGVDLLALGDALLDLIEEHVAVLQLGVDETAAGLLMLDFLHDLKVD
ncbi:unnamed protein product [Sphagnum balticum]